MNPEVGPHFPTTSSDLTEEAPFMCSSSQTPSCSKATATGQRAAVHWEAKGTIWCPGAKLGKNAQNKSLFLW